MKRLLPGFILCCALASTAALAQEAGSTYPRGQGWSALAATPVGANQNVLVGQLGWPGFSLGVLHGASPRLDLGGKFSLNYGQEGIVEIVEPGLKLQAWVRLMLAQTSQFSMALTFQPGPLFYFHEESTDVGLALPVALVAGIPVSSALMLNVGLDVPFHVYFGTGGGPVFPILVGGGIEYFLSHQLAASFNVRMGPSIFPDSGRRGGSEAFFTLEALIGVAWRL